MCAYKNVLSANTCEYFACYFYENINYCLDKSLLFPLYVKLADVQINYKKIFNPFKDNCSSINILSNISEVYEKSIYDQIHYYFDKTLSNKLCGFRKGYNVQHCLIALIEKCKKGLIMVVNLVLC